MRYVEERGRVVGFTICKSQSSTTDTIEILLRIGYCCTGKKDSSSQAKTQSFCIKQQNHQHSFVDAESVTETFSSNIKLMECFQWIFDTF